MKKLDRKQSLFLIFIAALAVVIVINHSSSASGNHNSVKSTVDATTTTMHAATTTTGVDYLPASQAGNYLNQIETVRVNIAYTFTDSAGTEFLDQYVNYTSGFVVSIFSSDLANFPVDPATTYGGSTIDVTGPVTTFDGYVEILNPSSIKIVG